MSQQDDRRNLVPFGSPERRCQILQELGSGRLASLYLACRCGEEGCEASLALKHAHASGSTFDPADILAHEAFVASRVHHPNVLHVLDVEDVDGALVLVMEDVMGAPLSALLRAGAVAPSLVGRIVLMHAAALPPSTPR